MDPMFLRDVQANGWHIRAVTESSVIGKCPSVGCNLHAELHIDGHIPAVDPGCRRDLIDQKVESYSDIQGILKERREGLALSIRETEEIAGIATDHIAKMEKENPSKIPNAEILIEWAQALGYEVVFRPIPMTSYAIRTICDTRDKVASRTKRFRLEERRRGSR